MNGNTSTLSARSSVRAASGAAGDDDRRLRRRGLLRRADVAPNADLFAGPAHAQNLTQQAQQLPQQPVGFADIVEKVKPAVISVRVKMERPADPALSDDELPFPPGSPFERFFKRFGMPNNGRGRRPRRSSPARAPASSSPPTATP